MNTWEQALSDRSIRVKVQKLDEGWDISVTGGVKTHVGAVTLAEPDGTECTLERPGHKDSHISRTWALTLAQEWNAPVCVRCGIHYDNATSEQVQAIVTACNQLLETVIRQMAVERHKYPE